MLRSLSHIGQKRFVSEGLNRQGLGQTRQRGGARRCICLFPSKP
ncbi:unnamed protein product [Brassica napus]|uniref:(rape) hypothetical protein n=1 Tax=Brassica napus TaxID=3708 RepID=A0A817B4S0_BRANA|nr:unnamed protein product [Brassica napus]